MPDIKTVGIVSKPGVSAAAMLVPELMEWLERRGLRLRYDQPTGAYAGRNDAIPREQVPEGSDLVIVLGGDGTLLSAARAIGRSEVPLFPVNLGGLGFLTAITIDEIYPELERAFRGEHRVGKRRFLHIDVIRGERHHRLSRSPERRRAFQGRHRPHDRPGRLRGRPVRLRL